MTAGGPRSHRPPRERIGWLPDPWGRFDLRLRMRRGWTQRVRVGTAEAIDTAFDPDADPDGAVGPEPGADDRGVGASEDGEWRVDPTGRFDHRWWEAGRFTRRVRHGGAVATDTVGPPRARHRWRWPRRRRVDPEGPGWRPDPDGEGERYHDGHDWTAKWRAGAAQPSNPPGSLRAWLPRTVVRVGVTAIVVLAVVAVVVGLAVLAGLG